jgi:hypothetical protein
MDSDTDGEVDMDTDMEMDQEHGHENGHENEHGNGDEQEHENGQVPSTWTWTRKYTRHRVLDQYTFSTKKRFGCRTMDIGQYVHGTCPT